MDEKAPLAGDTLVIEHDDGHCAVMKLSADDVWEPVRAPLVPDIHTAYDIARATLETGATQVWFKRDYEVDDLIRPYR